MADTVLNIAYEFYMNGTKLSTNSCRASFVSPYNKLTIKMLPNISLSYWEARVTPDATHTIDEYDIGEGVLAAWSSNVTTSSQTSIDIDVNSTNFSKGDGTYRISLYGKNSLNGLWDVTYLFFTVNNEPFIPTGTTGMEVLTDRDAPEHPYKVTIYATGDCPGVVTNGIVYDGTSTSGTNLGTVGSSGASFDISSGHIYIDCGSGSDDRLSGATSTGGVTNAYATPSSQYSDRYAKADVSGNGTLTINTYEH